MLLRFLPYYAADDDGGSGGTGDPPEGKIKPSDILNRYGQTAESALRMAEKLAESENTNWQLREKNRTLRQERDDARGKVPGDDVVTLPKETAALLDAYTALGKPDALKQAIDANGDATAKLAKLERSEQIRKAADASGFKAGVLERLAGDLPIEIRDVDGKATAFVKDDKGERLLTEHATVAWADFLPSLTATGVEGQTRSTPFIQQHGNSVATPPQSAAQAYINRNYNKGAS